MTDRFIIRPFTEGDYPAYAAVSSAVFPDHAFSADELRYRDEHLDPRCIWRRWMALEDGDAVGWGGFRHSPWAYAPHSFYADVQVLPAHRVRGVGGALYRTVVAELEPHDPEVLRAMCNEPQEQAIGFLTRRGFAEEQRYWESRLDFSTFDPSPYADLQENLAREGILLKTLNEVRDEPGWERKLYDLIWAVEQGIPTNETLTRVDFDTFLDNMNTDPGVIPDGFIIATRGDELIGLSNLRLNQATPDLTTGLTGVTPEWRGRKIALAMKVRALLWAKSQGYPMTKTWNDSRNGRMLEINIRLGFVRQPAWLQFVKQLETRG